MKIINTHTGKIYVDRERQLEFLTVGDYGKSNNIKADFLGLTKEINGVENTPVDLTEKWVAIISSQHGCPMKCRFCDCPDIDFGYRGNASLDDLTYQIETILADANVRKTERFNVHYARIGEPTFNDNILAFSRYYLKPLVGRYIKAKTIHPVVSTMMPKCNKNLERFLLDWCDIKNNVFNGEAGLQLSINSTDESQRTYLFDGMSLSLDEVSAMARRLPAPEGRKYTLNFPVANDTIIDAGRLSELFDKDRFIVKITPVHETTSATANGYLSSDGYKYYDVYRRVEAPLVDAGWDVIVFIPSKEEDEDRITCGNALMSD